MPESERRPSEPTINLVIIEDDADDVFLVGRMLREMAGRQVAMRHAATLAEGLRELAAGGADAVLLDLTLPDSTGEETFRTVYAQFPRVPIVVLSGLHDEQMACRTVQQGAQDYLLKGTFDGELLRRAVLYAIERQRLVRELEEKNLQLEESGRRLQAIMDRLKELVQHRTRDLLRVNEDLNAEIAEHKHTETALRDAVKRLELHNRAQADFVSNVSHELKTPLASISYAVGNLLGGVAGDIPERVRSYLTMIQEDTSRLGATIADILDMSRIEARTLVLKRVKLHLPRLILQSLAAVQSQAIAKRQRITFSAERSHAFVSVDTQRFERVILNVVGNAMKYSPVGALIEVRMKWTRRGEGNGRDYVGLTVSDSGIGIAPEHIDRVTERYYRVGEHVDGTGLGLALCKEITELHGGKLEIRSPPEDRPAGTQVTILLPICEPPTVLVVDDEEIVLRLVGIQLESHGYRVILRSNALQALDALENSGADLLVTDVAMPGVDGIGLVSRVRSHPAWQELPIVVITGQRLDASRLEVLDGFDLPVVTKPWKAEELVAAMEDAAAGRSVRNVGLAIDFQPGSG